MDAIIHNTIHVLLALTLPPLLPGVIGKTKALFAGRVGPVIRLAAIGRDVGRVALVSLAHGGGRARPGPDQLVHRSAGGKLPDSVRRPQHAPGTDHDP